MTLTLHTVTFKVSGAKQCGGGEQYGGGNTIQGADMFAMIHSMSAREIEIHCVQLHNGDGKVGMKSSITHHITFKISGGEQCGGGEHKAAVIPFNGADMFSLHSLVESTRE